MELAESAAATTADPHLAEIARDRAQNAPTERPPDRLELTRLGGHLTVGVCSLEGVCRGYEPHEVSACQHAHEHAVIDDRNVTQTLVVHQGRDRFHRVG